MYVCMYVCLEVKRASPIPSPASFYQRNQPTPTPTQHKPQPHPPSNNTTTTTKQQYMAQSAAAGLQDDPALAAASPQALERAREVDAPSYIDVEPWTGGWGEGGHC